MPQTRSPAPSRGPLPCRRRGALQFQAGPGGGARSPVLGPAAPPWPPRKGRAGILFPGPRVRPGASWLPRLAVLLQDGGREPAGVPERWGRGMGNSPNRSLPHCPLQATWRSRDCPPSGQPQGEGLTCIAPGHQAAGSSPSLPCFLRGRGGAGDVHIRRTPARRCCGSSRGRRAQDPGPRTQDDPQERSPLCTLNNRGTLRLSLECSLTGQSRQPRGGAPARQGCCCEPEVGAAQGSWAHANSKGMGRESPEESRPQGTSVQGSPG